MISYLDMSNDPQPPTPYWTYYFQSNQIASSVIARLSVGPSQIVAALCGDPILNKYLVVLNIPSKGLAPVAGPLKYNELNPTALAAAITYMSVFAMIITSATEIQTLLYDRFSDVFKLATFRLDELKIYYQTIFMGLTNISPADKYLRGMFVNKDTYFVGLTGT